MKKLLPALTLLGVFATLPSVHALTFNYEAGVLHDTSAFASFNTTGADMAGMGVHVEYMNGTTYDAVWQSFGAGFGGVNTSSLFLQAGSTGTTDFAWMLYNPGTTLGIRSVSLDGQAGNTVFDVSFPFGEFAGFNFVGTPGTSGGREFDLSSIYSNLYNGISITYSDAVGLGGDAPVGDVFRRMKIEFAAAVPLSPGALIEFRQDTDSLAFGSVLAPAASGSVPEGGVTLSMLCAGLLGLAACSRRRGLAG